MERWFRFLCFAFVVYAVLQGHSAKKSPPSPPTITHGTPFKPAMVEATEDAGVLGKMVASGLNKVVSGITMDAEAEAKLRNLLKEAAANTAQPAFKILSEQKGSGDVAYCGARVGLAYALQTNTPTKEAVMDTKEEPVTVEIGQHHMIAAIENAAVGMRAGGKREVRIAAEYLENSPLLRSYFKDHAAAKEMDFVASLHLKEVHNPDPNAASAPLLQHFVIEKGRGKRAICGDKVSVRYQLKKTDGTLMKGKKKSGLLQATLQYGQLPTALEHALMGMQAGERRMVLVPGLLLKKPKNSLSLEQEYDLNDAEIYQLELQLMNIQ